MAVPYSRDHGGDEIVEGESEEEDFYGYLTDALDKAANAGPEDATAVNAPIQTVKSNDTTIIPNPEQVKAENHRKAELLRAKLIAQRQNTPSKTISRSNTPSKAPLIPTAAEVNTVKNENEPNDQVSSDSLGLDALIAESKANAETKMKEQDLARSAQAVAPGEQLNGTNLEMNNETHTIPALPAEKTNGVVNGHSQQPQEAHSKPQLSEELEPTQTNGDHEAVSEQPKSATKLTDSYYADLAIWLEYTGYHDVEYRNSKLRPHKERKSLEDQAAKIQERLEKIRQDEQATIDSMRTATAHTSMGTQTLPPPLPANMPTPISTTKAPTTNGVKRARSPEPTPSERERATRRRADDHSNGFRIRGVNGSPASVNPSPDLERRISYPEVRGDPRNNRPSRDASLERRQSYYNREDAGRYERLGAYEGRGRVGYSSVNIPRLEAGREHGDRYRGRIGTGNRNGNGDSTRNRYFMIKSWNHENVATAMRDGLWATQTKNEKLLTDAYYETEKQGGEVLLLFSVNKSMAFQGYAIMTSPPSPSLPLPTFCTKLNWATSPAFSLKWISTTSVHFRHVGHLKNSLNLDEKGVPMAVLVGKDGQEIEAGAGRGLCGILDEAEEDERAKGGRR